jgi:nucleotide-binding universal stress UspA family protein
MIDAALFGSTTHTVLRKAPCPILTVPPSARSAAVAA